MKRGDKVFVFAAGDLRHGAFARIVMASENSNSLLLTFGETKPEFLNGIGFAVHPAVGIVMTLLRDETTKPFWKDIFSGHHYGISQEH